MKIYHYPPPKIGDRFRRRALKYSIEISHFLDDRIFYRVIPDDPSKEVFTASDFDDVFNMFIEIGIFESE